jgi:hypothetical protein
MTVGRDFLVRNIRFPNHIPKSGKVVSQVFKCRDGEDGLSFTRIDFVPDSHWIQDYRTAISAGLEVLLGCCFLPCGELPQDLDIVDDPVNEHAYSHLHVLVKPCPNEIQRRDLAKIASQCEILAVLPS